jgi:hypothetical protein
MSLTIHAGEAGLSRTAKAESLPDERNCSAQILQWRWFSRALPCGPGLLCSNTLNWADILDEHFSQTEAELQLKTLIAWGRYARLFDYDANEGLLYLAAATGIAPESKPNSPSNTRSVPG